MRRAIIVGSTNTQHSRFYQWRRVLAREFDEVQESNWRQDNQLGFSRFAKHKKFRGPKLGLIGDAWRMNADTLRMDRGSTVIVAHPSQLNILIIFLSARLKKLRIVLDFYVSLNDTLVEDRMLVPQNSFMSKVLKLLDDLALRLSDTVVFDTKSNLERFVGSRTELLKKSFTLYPSPPSIFFNQNSGTQESSEIFGDVLFVGAFSPVMGTNTVCEAIEHPSLSRFQFTLVGSGQDSEILDRLKTRDNVRLIPWVQYEEIPALIANHKITLGHFGTSEKAKSVFPNKVAESLAVGVPCIAREGEISMEFSDIGCHFIEPGNSAKLITAIETLLSEEAVLKELSSLAKSFSLAQQCLERESKNEWL